MPKNFAQIIKELATFFGRKLDNVGVEIKGAEVVTIKGERGEQGDKGDAGPVGPKGEVGPQGEIGPQGDQGPEGKVGKQGLKGERGLTGPTGKNGKDGKPGKNGKDGKPGKDFDPDKLKAIEAKFKDIDGELRTVHANHAQVFAFSGSTVLTHDLSASLDGVTTTFTLPSNARVLLVIASSFPNIFRPTVDYTTTASSITFTSEINAATTLASGQSIVILYKLP